MMRILKRRREVAYPDEALAAAADLVSADEPLEAIRLLTEANRKQRDRKIERRIVELRLDAFRRLGWPDTRSVLPEVVDDLFPGELIPEVARADITVECVRSAFRNHGSLIVRGLVDRDHVDRLIDDIDSAFDAFDDFGAAGEERVDLAGWYRPVQMHNVGDEQRATKRKNGSILAVESPPALFDLIEILNEVGVGRLARDYLGESPAILARKVTLRRMPHTATGAWHQDGAFMGLDLTALNVWLALTPCGDDAPSLDVVGRRLDYIVKPGGASKAYGVSPEMAEQVAAGAIVRPKFEPGDALFFDHLCLHRTGHDPSMQKGRYAIETWLMAPSSYSAMTTRVEDGFQPDDQVPLVF